VKGFKTTVLTLMISEGNIVDLIDSALGFGESDGKGRGNNILKREKHVVLPTSMTRVVSPGQ
jgi:hypothetical protein